MSDERLMRASDPSRESRAVEDRARTEGREISDDEWIAEFRKQNVQSALPDIPAPKGYHICWLSTEAKYDTIESRVRKFGYSPLLREDVPGWSFDNVKSSDHPGWPISCNEMVAAKLPIGRYEALMREFHHDQPMAEQHKLSEVIRGHKRQAAAKGADVVLEDGIRDLASTARAPNSW